MTVTPHIYTLTGNLLAERTLEFDAWSPGKTQRAHRQSFQVGGKGINVSKMLNRLRAPNTALCFLGGAPGAECEAWLREKAFSFVGFSTDRPTRTGTVVRGSNHPETTFLGADTPPSADAIKACAEYLNAQPDGQVLALCGSFPGWGDVSFDVLRAAMERWIQRGVLAADVYGPPLVWAAQRRVALVKINATEFRGLVPDAASIEVGLAKLPANSGAARWVVSDGANTVWLKEADAAAVSLTPPRVTEISATGSGDVMFASILDSLFRRRVPLREAVATALPLGAANAAHPGVAEFPWEF